MATRGKLASPLMLNNISLQINITPFHRNDIMASSDLIKHKKECYCYSAELHI
ncbi:hypothetical protein DAI22_09g201601 [Oryza sativa Japonica Group]|nr:hypothetical protein DAI22_09g201601 [Oryza sativa Japonica Group]